jgi:hypothetical protein
VLPGGRSIDVRPLSGIVSSAYSRPTAALAFLPTAARTFWTPEADRPHRERGRSNHSWHKAVYFREGALITE